MKQSRQKKFLLLILIFLGPAPSFAASTEDAGDLVKINYPLETLAPYRDRRRTSGVNFGVHLEEYIPRRWTSVADGLVYGDTFGKTPIDLISVEAGYKFNFAPGSLSALLGLGYGQAKANFANGTQLMTVIKPFAKAMYTMDNLFPEPWVAPYAAASVWQMNVNESFTDSTTDDKTTGSVGTGIGFDYTLGLLFQLNWIEQDLARDSLNTLGLQNTYLDIFATQYMKTQRASDPDTSSDFVYGAGLRLEF